MKHYKDHSPSITVDSTKEEKQTAEYNNLLVSEYNNLLGERRTKEIEMNEQPTIKKGDFFTVVRWLDSNDMSYVGSCLEAIVIDGDLIRVKNHGGYINISTISTSRVEVRLLGKEFVDSVLNEENNH